MKFVFLISEYQYYQTHRKSLIDYILNQDKNNIVHVLTNFEKNTVISSRDRLNFININFNRNRIDFIKLLQNIILINNILNSLKPDIVHCVSMKTIIIGGILSFFKKLKFIFSVNGLGSIYTDNSYLMKSLKIFFNIFFYSILFKKNRFITVQNNDEYIFFKNLKIKISKIFLIKGSGVDLNKFYPLKDKNNKNLRVAFIGRLIKYKGIREFLSISKMIKKSNLARTKFYIFGKFDNNNRYNIKINEIRKYYVDNYISWFGYKSDIWKYLNKIDIAIFPSTLREGIPLSLLQAIASGVSVIASDIPGCRDIIKNNFNGNLVKKGDINEFYEALVKLLNDEDKRKKYCNQNQEIIKEFSQENINYQFYNLYLND